MRILLLALGLCLMTNDARGQSATDLKAKAHIEALRENPGAEELERKARSVAQIEAMGVPVAEHMPVIMAEGDSLRRSDEEVMARAIGLMIVAVKGELRDFSVGRNLVVQYQARDFLTPMERAYISNRTPDQQTYVSMTWRYESALVMLWALGFIDALPPPDQIADAGELGRLMAERGTDVLMAEARLRPQSELLDAADLHYRLNWAAVDARVNATPMPQGLDPSILYERHYALNWLIGYLGLPWDEMRTDT